jgi:hypothetical protein
MSTTGIAIRRYDHTISTPCSVCGAVFEHKTYHKVTRCPEHRTRRRPSKAQSRNAKITGTCSVCGGQYQCNKVHYEYKQRNGRTCYCPACVKQKNSATTAAANQKRVGGHEIKEWVAPCRMKIIPKREGTKSRCEPALTGKCPMVMTCIDFACQHDWAGWKVAK